MDLKVGMSITAETIYKNNVSGTVTSILGNSVIIENDEGRHLIKSDVLRDQGYEIQLSNRTDKRFYT